MQRHTWIDTARIWPRIEVPCQRDAMSSHGTATQTAAAIDQDEKLYRIGDVSRLTELKPFVLRFWETEFPMLQPVKSPSGHRLYRREDIETVFEIKRLLYDERFTIAGARRHLAEHSGHNGTADGQAAPELAPV